MVNINVAYQDLLTNQHMKRDPLPNTHDKECHQQTYSSLSSRTVQHLLIVYYLVMNNIP